MSKATKAKEEIKLVVRIKNETNAAENTERQGNICRVQEVALKFFIFVLSAACLSTNTFTFLQYAIKTNDERTTPPRETAAKTKGQPNTNSSKTTAKTKHHGKRPA